jgi:hypothetical protein
MRPGWENELCLTLGATLNGPGVSEDDVKAAVATVAPALEIIEQRPPVGKGSGFLSGADNGQQRSLSSMRKRRTMLPSTISAKPPSGFMWTTNAKKRPMASRSWNPAPCHPLSG